MQRCGVTGRCLCRYILGGSSAGPPQMCSPIMEISIWFPQDEHFIVGRKLDCLSNAAMLGQLCMCYFLSLPPRLLCCLCSCSVGVSLLCSRLVFVSVLTVGIGQGRQASAASGWMGRWLFSS